MALPDGMEKAYHEELTKYEEEIKMHVTTAERIGTEKGREQKALETAKNLFLLGILTEEQIAQATELPIEEVRRIHRQLRDSAE